jgi:archaemetzincin
MGPDGSPASLRLLVIGPAPPLPVPDLAAKLSRRVALPCRAGTRVEDLDLATVSGRDQVDADRLLERIHAWPAEPGTVLVGLTALDVAIPTFTFVFGRARLGGRAALVSTARLDPRFYGLPWDAELAARRATDEVIHELGHAAGLRHCNDAFCLMRFAGSVDQVDARGSTFCPGCAGRLPYWLRAPRQDVEGVR